MINQFSCATNEALKTKVILHKILTSITIGSHKSHLKGYREEVVHFARQAEFQQPSFSAAGFMMVDYEMLFTIFSTVLYYFVVLMQWQRASKFRI